MAGPTIRGTKNRLAVPAVIANEALFRLKTKLFFPRFAQRTFQSYFLDKNGEKIWIKRPTAAKTRKGRKIPTNNSTRQPMIDRYIEMTLDQRHNFDTGWNDEEASLDIVALADRYIDPGAEELAYQYDIEGANELGNGGQWCHPFPDIALDNNIAASALTPIEVHTIRALAQERHIPVSSKNWAILHPLDLVAINDAILKLPAGTPSDVSNTLRDHYAGTLANFQIYDSVHVPRLVCAADRGTPLINGIQADPSQLVTDGWTASKKVLNKGQLFTVAGVREIQPRGDRRNTGRLQTFTVQEDVTSDASGNATIKIEPHIITATTTTTDADGTSISMAAYQTVDKDPFSDAVITVVGKEGNEYYQDLFWHGAALEYANVALTLPEGAEALGGTVQTDPETGLQIMMLRDFDWYTAESKVRLDIFFGVKCVRPDLVIRKISTKVG